MCYKQILIPTRSRVLSLIHRQPLLQLVPCGKCFECQSVNHLQWYYRIYHEWLDCVENGSDAFVFFTTLTYSDEYLPHLSDVLDIEKGSDLDFPCFSRVHLRKFLTRLTDRLKVKFRMSSTDYHRFVCAEYGTDERYTHRPHYHCLFFIKRGCNVQDLRSEIDNAWQYGFTDRIRLTGLHANVFRGRSSRSELAVSNYVAKYVQKISLFQKEIDFPINTYMDRFVSQYADSLVVTKTHVDIDNPDTHRFADSFKVVHDDDCVFYQSQTYKNERRKLVRLVDQFHLQSKGFGACALRDIDVNDLIEHGFLTMPDTQHIIRKIPLSKYYERKIFYELREVNGYRVWIPNRLGVLYKRNKLNRVVSRLTDKFSTLNEFYSLGLTVDFQSLAKYAVYYKGRNRGSIAHEPDLTELVQLPSNFLVYNYSCPTDKALFHGSFVTRDFVGCQGVYTSHVLDDAIPFASFIKNRVIDDSFLPAFHGFDAALNVLYDCMYKSGEAKQKLFEYKQDYRNRIKVERCVSAPCDL